MTPPISPKDAKALAQQLGRKYVADSLTPKLHLACAGSPTCVRAGPTDVAEEDQERFARELPAELTVDENAYTDLQNDFVDAYRAEWLAKVKPCK
jgi:hypothetical protein